MKGDIVWYHLSHADIMSVGAGKIGDSVPMLVVEVLPPKRVGGVALVTGHVFLAVPRVIFRRTVPHGTLPGHWDWETY